MSRQLPYRTTEEKREQYIKLTAHIINRSVEATRELVAKWPTQKVVKRFNDSLPWGTRHIDPGVKWWAARKRAND